MIEEIKRTITECDNIDSLAFDTWGRDYGLLVERDYLMRQPFVCSSSITKHIPQKYIRHLSQEELYRATGIGFMSTSTLFQLMVEKGKALDPKNILFMSDLFAWALCGNRTVDRTIASASQLVNPLTGDWNYNITLLTPFRFLFFPEIVDPGTICGYYNGIAVTKVAGHNVQSAIAAMPCKEKEEAAFLVDGASPVIGCELDNPVLTKTSLEAGLFNEIGANRKFNYLKNVRGICLIRDMWKCLHANGREYSYDGLVQIAKEASACRCFIDLDAPEFLETDHILERIKRYCAKTNQITPKTDGMFVRCVYDSLAMKYRYAVEQIQNITGKKFNVFYVLGESAADDLLCQTMADVLGVPVIAGPAEAAAIGNILLQLIALQAIADVGDGQRIIRKSEKQITLSPSKQQPVQ